ncbi:MAG: hypothetical protein K9K63_09650 [Desulfotignum sp.]|nr:hypothetical protein [Desulfotignum sp.]MCF8089284.1 hypothetical protein [Desulfotignum sp.]MCF8137561.1 hypothetical protein [Desulfotignum sp.]
MKKFSGNQYFLNWENKKCQSQEFQTEALIILNLNAYRLNNAGMLTGLILSQLKREGSPFIAPGMGAAAL